MYNEKLFLEDTSIAASLKSSLTNEEYLDAISAPRIDSLGRTKTKARSKRSRVMVELPETDESEAEAHVGAQEAPAGGLPPDEEAAASIERMEH